MASYAALHAVTSEQDSRPASRATNARRRTHPKQGGVGGTASWTSSVINLVNTIVGAGMLAMPHAMSNMGILLGTIVILWSGVASGFGLYLQTRCARYLDRGTASFFALSQITYPNAAVVFDAAIAIKCFGVGVSYLIIIGDLMPGVVLGFARDGGGSEFLLDRKFWITAFMLIVIPLSFLRKLDSLKYTSIVALVSIAYLVVLVVYHYASGDTIAERGEVHWLQWQGAIPTLASFPVIVFAYTCHQNMFSILNEIGDNSPFRTTSVVISSNTLSSSLYVLVAITGYLSFGSAVVDNIAAQYRPSVFSTIGRAAIVINVMFSYPLQVHPCRASVDAVSKWRPATKANSELTPASGSPSRNSPLQQKVPIRPKTEDMSDIRFAVITTAIIILSYIVAMTVSSLGRVLAYVGATGSTSISFILPGLFYYKISSPDSPHHQRLLKDEDDNEEYNSASGSESEDGSTSSHTAGRSSWRDSWTHKVRRRQWRRDLLRKLSLALAIYGIVVMVVCLVMNTFHTERLGLEYFQRNATIRYEYLLAPNFDLPPPPNGPLKLGHILDDPNEPRYPLNLEDVVEPLESETYSQTATGVTTSRGQLRSKEFKIWAHLADLLPLGGDAGFAKDKSANDVFRVKTIETTYFLPTTKFLERSLQSQEVMRYLEAGFWSNKVYIVTGMKVARGASVSSASFDGTAVSGGASVDLNPAAIPVSFGAHAGSGKAEDGSTSIRHLKPFVLAYQVRRVVYKKNKPLRTEAYNKGAMFEKDSSRAEDSSEGLVVEGLEEVEESAGELEDDNFGTLPLSDNDNAEMDRIRFR